MSIRSNRTDDSYASAVRRDLSQLKTTALEASRLDNLDASVRPEGAEAAAAYDSLAPHEQSAASLGVHPDALKPIVRRRAPLPPTLPIPPCSSLSVLRSRGSSTPAITRRSRRATPCRTTWRGASKRESRLKNRTTCPTSNPH